MAIIGKILEVTSRLIKGTASASEHLFEIGKETAHSLGLLMEYEHFDLVVPASLYLMLIGYHEVILKKIAKLHITQRQEFKQMILLDDISLTLVCLPAIALKLYPTKSIRMQALMSSFIYALLIGSFFIQKQMNNKLLLLS